MYLRIAVAGLENYTFLTLRHEVRETNVYAGPNGRILKRFSNAVQSLDVTIHKRASGKSRMVTATRRLSVSPRAVATRRMLDGATHIPTAASHIPIESLRSEVCLLCAVTCRGEARRDLE